MKRIALVIVIVITAILLMGTVKVEKKPRVWKSYEVKKGDTLFKIALESTPKGEDYRDLVYYIIEKNGIKNATIYPGEVLLVPVLGRE